MPRLVPVTLSQDQFPSSSTFPASSLHATPQLYWHGSATFDRWAASSVSIDTGCTAICTGQLPHLTTSGCEITPSQASLTSSTRQSQWSKRRSWEAIGREEDRRRVRSTRQYSLPTAWHAVVCRRWVFHGKHNAHGKRVP